MNFMIKRLFSKSAAGQKLRFQFDEEKGLEALLYIATEWNDVTAFYASKVVFYAEKFHLNRYARPIVGDTFIAMPNGPVPSEIYNIIKGKWDQTGDPEAIENALNISTNSYRRVRPRRAVNRNILSDSDIECLDAAIAFCKARSFGALSNLSHQEQSWMEAPANGPMEYETMIDPDNPKREAILAEAREFAAYGVN